MAFGPNDRCYVLNHGIVCDVVPILCMCVDIGMENTFFELSEFLTMVEPVCMKIGDEHR